MELKFSLSKAKLTKLHTHHAAGFVLSCCLKCPNLAKTLCPHLEGSLLATDGGRARVCRGGYWKVIVGGGAISPVCRHSVCLSLAQLSATIFRKEGLEAWPQLMQLLQHSTHSPHIPEREVLSHSWREGGTERLDRPRKLFPLISYSCTDGAFAAKCGSDLPA